MYGDTSLQQLRLCGNQYKRSEDKLVTSHRHTTPRQRHVIVIQGLEIGDSGVAVWAYKSQTALASTQLTERLFFGRFCNLVLRQSTKGLH
jgi:hypothetical protein